MPVELLISLGDIVYRRFCTTLNWSVAATPFSEKLHICAITATIRATLLGGQETLHAPSAPARHSWIAARRSGALPGNRWIATSRVAQPSRMAQRAPAEDVPRSR